MSGEEQGQGQEGLSGSFDPEALKNDILSSSKTMIESAMRSTMEQIQGLIKNQSQPSYDTRSHSSSSDGYGDYGEDLYKLTEKIDLSQDSAKALLDSSASHTERRLLGKVVTKEDLAQYKQQLMEELKADLSENITKDVLSLTEYKNKRIDSFKKAQTLYPDLMDKNSDLYKESLRIFNSKYGKDTMDPEADLNSAHIAAANLGIPPVSRSRNPLLTESTHYSNSLNPRETRQQEMEKKELARTFGVDEEAYERELKKQRERFMRG